MDRQHRTVPGELASEVPQTEQEDPHATEKAALTWIETAMTHVEFVQRDGSSREASLAATKLEEAQMWLIRDIQKKENS